ncbi:hypothetical protein [Legionella sp. km772]|uniref:hypothetical protein n=1 Tax=Legionella sp. km772 TaxID=2498111 RepID=UPI000F8CD945|nr:hypothetical protein [Legionella sp. km772]RUR13657.1 hypothetical protein ELY15_01700 [Legionella sp. km772]
MMSFLFGLFIGCGLGAVGYHYYQQYKTNESPFNNQSTKKNNDMAFLFEHYPYLMNLIKSNLSDPEYKNIREFFIVDKLAIMNSSVPRLRYDLGEETLALAHKLEEFGYIERLEHDSLLYRMDEDFIADLNAFKPLMLSVQEPG